MLYGQYATASSGANFVFTGNPASLSVDIVSCAISEGGEVLKPDTPWKRRYAAYEASGRAAPAIWRSRRLQTQQRARDGLHAIN